MILLVLFSVMMLFLSGCKGGVGNDMEIADVRKGFDGLKIEFHENAPPPKTFHNGSVDFIVTVSNEGASNVTGGYFVLALEEDYISLPSGYGNKVPLEIEGKSIYYPEPQNKYFEFSGEIKELDPMIEKIDSYVVGIVCYDYGTIANFDVCVETDKYGKSFGMKPCTDTDINAGGGQGGPVAVTRVEQNTKEDNEQVKPLFIITIENKGDGLVVNPQYVNESCDSSLVNNKEWNKILLKAKLGNTVLDCDPPYIDLKEKMDRVRCRYPEYASIEKRQGNFVTNLNIELKYGYTSSNSRKIEIER